MAQPSNRPVVGEKLFNVESGIIASWVKNVGQANLTEAFPYRPELVGQPQPEIVLGKGSGLDSVAVNLDKNGLSAATPVMEAILQDVKGKSLEVKRLLTNDEFLRIAEEHGVST